MLALMLSKCWGSLLPQGVPWHLLNTETLLVVQSVYFAKVKGVAIFLKLSRTTHCSLCLVDMHPQV